jgi:UDP-glucose 4-epimerase
MYLNGKWFNKTGAGMNNMNGKILVTGGAGYIGSHVVKLLCDEKYPVVIIDNFSLGQRENVDPRALLIEGDILNESDLNKVFSLDIKIVFHFAAWKAAGESMIVPEKYATNNICGTIGLLNRMMQHGVKHFVFSSSAAVYGNPRYLPIDEKHSLNPENYYGYSKLAIEQNLAWYSRLKDLRYAALRYFNATGYDVDGRIRGKEKNPANLSPVVMEVAAGLREHMEVFGNDYQTPDGTCIRDYIHVTDLAQAHVQAMKYIMNQDKDLVVNLGTGRGHSVLEVIKTAERVTGKKINYSITNRRAGDPEGLVASCTLAAELLNWKAGNSDLDTIIKSMAGIYLT